MIGINVLWFLPSNIYIGKIVSIIIGILLIGNAIISPYFRYYRYRYSINEECIDIEEGYLFIPIKGARVDGHTFIPQDKLAAATSALLNLESSVKSNISANNKIIITK